jgi:acyl-CoA synthetase (NDP forming)
VAVKSGRSVAGARATTSHTGALIATSDVTVDALFKQSGVVRCDTLPELFDVARMLADHPVPAGPRVAIVTNAGGPGIMCADICEAEGLDVVDLPEEVLRELTTFVPQEASVANPVDLIASAPAPLFARTIETIASSGCADSIVVIYIPPFVTRTEEIVAMLSELSGRLAAADRPLPLVSVIMAGGTRATFDSSQLSAFAFPEDAARALARAVRYGVWRNLEEGHARTFEVRAEEAAGVIAQVLQRGPGWLDAEEVEKVLDCYGIRRVEQRVVRTPEAAAAAAEEIGFPIALKATGGAIIHKTELGAVRLGLSDSDAVLRAGRELDEHVSDEHGFIVQAMAGRGLEMLVGVVYDELFGPVVAVGAGGTLAELLGDVSVRLTPLSEPDVTEMIRSLRTFPLLDGYREAPELDVAALEDVTHRIGALVEAHHEIAELDLNPVIVLEDGVVVVDARIRIDVHDPLPPIGAR